MLANETRRRDISWERFTESRNQADTETSKETTDSCKEKDNVRITA